MSHKIYEGALRAEGFKYAIVVSRFNDFLTDKLLEGALDCLTRHGAADNAVSVIKVPGAFEIPYVASRLAKAGKHDAIICLGAIIRGDTPHFDYIAAEASKGVARIALESGLPVIFGIVTADTLEQAVERSGTKAGNKGWDAAETAIELVNLYKKI